MGGRGANSKISIKGVNTSSKYGSQSLTQLSKRMAELAPYASPSKYSDTAEYISKKAEYYNVQEQYSNLKKISSASKSTANKEGTSSKTGTYVNSYGEATHRYITNQTYERAQKRSQKTLDSWFKRS